MGGFGPPGAQKPGDKKKEEEKKKQKWVPPKPTRVGKKRKKGQGPQAAYKLPNVVPLSKCKLRLLRLERIKDFLLLEEEFLTNQQARKPREEREEEEKSRVDEIRGSPMAVGSIEELIDENHAIISSATGPEYYVNIMSFVDKDQIEPGSTVLLHNKQLSVVGLLGDDVDPMVNVMKVDKAPTESYADIGGLQKQIQEVKEAVELPMTHPELYEDIGIKPPKGVIFFGPPGTGKTLLAKAVANETSATFLRVVGSELIQKYLGDGPKLVRELFRVADEHSPSIVFIDEIDAVGTKRYDSSSGGEREIQRTMLELLNQLDGFDARGEVKVIMATNRIETLDPALIRPGRIDRKIEFPLPDIATRRMVFRIHTQRMALTEDVDLEEFIQAKDDLSGADIKAICIAGGTPICLADGTSVPIEQVREGQVVLSHQDGVVSPTVVLAMMRQGVKECVELLFNDGRSLVCTPDHRLLLTDGRWVRADEIEVASVGGKLGGRGHAKPEIIGGSFVSTSVEYPLRTNETTSWSLDVTASLGYSLDMSTRRSHSLAFARLLGYVLTDGTASQQQISVFLGHTLDVNAVAADVQLLTGHRPHEIKRSINTPTIEVLLPAPLKTASIAVGVAVGSRPDKVTSFPPFLLHPSCPLPIVLEFLGGLFGGDGITLHLVHAAKQLRLGGLGWCCVKKGKALQPQLDQIRSELFPLLTRAGINTAHIRIAVSTSPPCSMTSEGAAHRQAMKEAGVPLSHTVNMDRDTVDPNGSYVVTLEFGTVLYEAFHRNIGFRYCCHKQVRLSSGMAYFHGKQYIQTQRERLRSLLNVKLAQPTVGYLHTARTLLAKEAADGALIHPVNARWMLSSNRREYHLVGRPDMVVQSDPSIVLNEAGSNRFFSTARPTPYKSSSSPPSSRSVIDLTMDEEKEQTVLSTSSAATAATSSCVTYGVQRGAVGLPVWGVKLVGRRNVGAKAVFDISVEKGESFIANGLVVHNCTEAGLLALRERRMRVTQKDFRAAKESAIYKKQGDTPEGLFL